MASQTDLSSSGCFPGLGVHTRWEGDHAVLSPYGELDHGSMPLLDEAIAALPDGVGVLVLDMAAATFTDSSRLHFLNRLHDYGRRFAIPVRALHWGPVSHELEKAQQEIGELRQALDTRAVIDQGRGMIMALGPCSAERAWAILVEVSQHSNTKLRVVAERLVATTGGQALEQPVQDALATALGRHRIRPHPSRH